jgi:hypothetical protein
MKAAQDPQAATFSQDGKPVRVAVAVRIAQRPGGERDMPKERKERRINPFRVGGLGLILLLAGYLLMYHVAPEADEAEQRRIADRLRQAAQAGPEKGVQHSPPARELLDRTSGYYRTRLHLMLGGRVAFYAGLALVLAAALIWYRQAQAPDEEEEPDPEEDGVTQDVPRGQMFP